MERYEVKFAADDISVEGRFAGYGAVFGNVDSHGDIIAKGAFTDTLAEWKARDRLPTMKLMHGGGLFKGDELPIGKWLSMEENEKGLFVEGKLSALDSDTGKRIYGLMKDGVLDGLSIGFQTTAKTVIKGQGAAKRRLDKVRLGEISLVDEGSNPLARVSENVKSLSLLSTEETRDLEALFRDEGLSRKDAKTAISGLKRWSQSESVMPISDLLDEGSAEELVKLLDRNIQLLS